ncbi:hypothetical protein C8R43DRAFT_75767 [Mycena crocata]|nr:hypothetical protein C8R43DRAFT_75767 [Mycena crocata]
MLRDKLHLLSAQVVEARERVAELEAIREGTIERVETKVEELVHKLVKKEEEGARGLADAAALEAQLHETGEKLREVLNTLEQRDLELGAFREQKVAWEWELKEKCAKIISLQSLSEDIVSLNERIGDLKEENISLECQLKEKCSRISALQTLETELSALKEVKTALQFKTNEDRSKIAALQISENELETRLSVVRDELETKLSAVRDEKAALECEVTECRCKIATLQDSQKATAAQLQQATDKAHQQEAQLTQLRAELADNAHRQDTQLVQLRAELKSVEDAKEQFRSSLEVSQQSATQLTQEVQALTVRGALLQEKSGEQAIRLDKLGADSSKLTNEASAREEELRQAKTKNSVLQERLDSQALTLKLAKEQSGDLQERLLISESSHIAKLESATGKLNIEIAVLREQKAGLQTTLNQVTEDATTQRNGYLGAAVDYENKLNKQEETHTKLVQAEERRAMSAEREAADAKRLVDDLIQQVESARAELEDAKKKSRDAASRESLGMEGEAVVLRARLEEVEGENSRLQHRAKILNKRYKDGDLSDSEKSFVNSLMQMSQSIHEQDIVAKENELRRRENMITSLQTRIETLESTLARLLKERGKEGDPNSKSMVDLSLWMSSSPRSAQKADAQPVASSSTHIRPPSPTVFVPDTPPVKKSSKATKPAASKPAPPTVHRGHKTLSAIDHDDEPLTDSEDETPISTTLGKRSRTPTSAKTDEPSRPARRVRATTSRNTTSRKVDPESSKKLAEGVKSKQRKRR